MRVRDLAVATFTFLAVAGCFHAAASVSIYMPPEHLAARADLVVEGTVTRTASGYDPETGALSTYVTLDVETVHRGPEGLEQVVLREPGGRYGELEHAVDAVPVYTAGERVLAFLDGGSDGVLRTTGMFFGKFRLEEGSRGTRRASRDLGGQGRILGGAPGAGESFSAGELAAVTASIPARRTANLTVGSPRRWTERPEEMNRLLWDDVRETPGQGRDPGRGTPGGAVAVNSLMTTAPVRTDFTTLFPNQAVRWHESDVDTAVVIHVQPDGNPLGDDTAAVDEIERALRVWTEVPQARVRLELGDPNYRYTERHVAGPEAYFSGVNVVLFGDPYEAIADPVACTGVLAIGGYWRAGSPVKEVNGRSFDPVRQLYVIFNDGFECFLGDPDNLAEIAAHEIGHGLGFGHSSAADSLMRATAYGNRGPRLGIDDVDAVHCHYPHEFEILAPAAGDRIVAGETTAIRWASSREPGFDPGSVDLEYRLGDSGEWVTIARGQANDGLHPWTVPEDAGATVRVRVSRQVLGPWAPSSYPTTCSGATGEAAAIADASASPRLSPAAKSRAGFRGRISGPLRPTYFAASAR